MRISDWSSDVCSSDLCSDPVALGLFMNWDQRSATIDKTRGRVYDYDGIKVIIVTPITAINRQFDERMLKDDDGEDIQSERSEERRVGKESVSTCRSRW